MDMFDKPSTSKGTASTPEQVVFRVQPSKTRVDEIYFALREAAALMARSASRLQDIHIRKLRRTQADTLSQLARDYKHFR